MNKVKSVACDPSCGFMIRSHDEEEIINAVKAHTKNMHGMETAEREIKSMMKSA